MRRTTTRAPALVPVLLAAATVGACATGIDSAVFMPAPPLPETADVRIYRTQLPPCVYDEVGLITWRPTSGWQKLQGGVERMRERAREMGAHAIVGFAIGERTGGTTTTITSDSASVTVGSSVDTQTLVSGTAIRFRDPACLR